MKNSVQYLTAKIYNNYSQLHPKKQTYCSTANLYFLKVMYSTNI